MKDSKEVYRSLAMLTQVSLQLLIPILIGVFGGIWLDKSLGISPWLTIVGSVVGIAAAFRNLYMWSTREIRRMEKSDRVVQAKRETGLGTPDEEEDQDQI